MYKKPFSQRFLGPAIILGLIAVLCSVGYAKGWIDYSKIKSNRTESAPTETVTKNNTKNSFAKKQEEEKPTDPDTSATNPEETDSEKVNETSKATQPPVASPAPTSQNTSNDKPAPQPASVAPKQTVTPKPTVTATAKPSNSQPSPASVPAPSTEIQAILNAINAARQQNGLSAVRLNSLLNTAAQAKSQDMYTNNYFAHTSPSGVSDQYFVNQVGYRYKAAGVNLAEGDFGGAQGLVDAWMNSPGHRANILADFGQDLGIGIVGKYFTMIIAKPL